MTVVYLDTFRCDLGEIEVAATERGLCRVTIPGEAPGRLAAWLRSRLPEALPVPAEGRLDGAMAAIDRYLDGEFEPLHLPVDLYGTPFQVRVWEAVLAIPYGETRSYAEIAAGLGIPRAARAVGSANAVNPLAFVVPCQRVIGADGSVKGYPGGVVTRAMLLEMERRTLAAMRDTPAVAAGAVG